MGDLVLRKPLQRALQPLTRRPTNNQSGSSISDAIRMLFAAGEQGAWYDPSDFSTLYQGYTGVAPVTAVGQPVGLMLDKRFGLVRGPELNGDPEFDTPGYWTANAGWVVAGGVATATAAANGTGVSRSSVLTVGKWYESTVVIDSITAGSVSVGYDGAGVNNVPSLNTPGTYTKIFQAVSTAWFGAVALTTFTGVISRASIKELPGNHATQATAGFRPTVSAKVNMLAKSQDFSDAVWTKTATGTGTNPTITANYGLAPDGTMTADRLQMTLNGGVTSADVVLIQQTPTLVVGQTYTHSRYIKATDAGNVGKVVSMRGADGATYTNITLTADWQRVANTGVASTTATVMQSAVLRGGVGTSDTADFLLWGAQLEDNATATRYQRVGQRNLVLKTDQFADAAWTKANATVTAAATVGIAGLMTGAKLVATAISSFHSTYQAGAGGAQTGTFTGSIHIKQAEYQHAWMTLDGSTVNKVHFNLATGVVTLQSGVATGTISDAGNGWWRCTVTQTLTAQSPYCYVAASNALNTVSYLGDGVSGVYIDGGQVEAGAVASAYLRVDTAANDYDASGFPVGLDFDIDDTMQTGTVDFTATNKVTAFAGTRKTSDAQGSIIVELGPNSQSTAGSFALFGTGSPGVGDQAWRSSGTAFALCAPAGSPAPISCVYTGQADIAADVCVLRKNGAQINTVATDQGTGNYSSNPLYIGARSGGTAGFVGRIYSLIVRGAATSAADVAAAERYVNAKTGAY